MPELPEVETVRRGLEPLWVGRRISVTARRGDLRDKLPRGLSRRLEGARVAAIERRAKYLLVRFADRDEVMVLHLGMSGRITRAPDPPPPPGAHDHVEFRLDGMVFRFNDPRRFGQLDLIAADKLENDKRFKALGPEPLDSDYTAEKFAAALAGKRTPIKAALLDQRVIAGVGNIYACEALHQAGVSPMRLAGTIKGPRAAALHGAVRDVLARAIKAGGSSARDYVQANGEMGWFQHHWAVYDREGGPCARCRAPIKRRVQSGRSTFYCARCQR